MPVLFQRKTLLISGGNQAKKLNGIIHFIHASSQAKKLNEIIHFIQASFTHIPSLYITTNLLVSFYLILYLTISFSLLSS
jgi:hypothetical protein